MILAAPPSVPGGAEDFLQAYELQGEVGRGSFAVVRLARHLATGQLRAVKCVSGGDGGAPSGKEAEVHASLHHPNVAQFFECFREGPELFMVQELCAGECLEERLAKQRRFEAGEATHLLRQMLEAVRHCHEAGVVHRDLKADNFVFASRERAAPLKLIDFGISDRCAPGDRLEGRAGTVEYSSPEALREEAGFGPPADIWAVGAIFFLLLTGEPLIEIERPRGGEESLKSVRANAARRVCDSRYVRLRVAAASTRVPPQAAHLLQRMLRQDPSTRFTAEEALRHPLLLESSQMQ